MGSSSIFCWASPERWWAGLSQIALDWMRTGDSSTAHSSPWAARSSWWPFSGWSNARNGWARVTLGREWRLPALSAATPQKGWGRRGSYSEPPLDDEGAAGGAATGATGGATDESRTSTAKRGKAKLPAAS